MPSKGSVPFPITVAVEKLVYGGDGLARVDGQVALVPFVIPGERVSTQARADKGRILRGALPTILQAAESRVVPRCEYFTSCGGCHYQHIEYTAELDQKRLILLETLRRLGNVDYTGEIKVIHGDPWQYRNRIQLHFESGQVGFWRMQSHAIRPITHCEISSPRLNEVIRLVDTMMTRPEWPRFLTSLEVFTNEDQVQLHVVESSRPVAARFFEWCRTIIPTLVPDAILYKAGGYEFQISRGTFFQVNRFLVDALMSEVVAEDVSGNHAVDLYAGAGLFSLPLANRFKAVDAIERGTFAYRDLEANASSLSGLVRTHRQSSEEFLRTLRTAPDLVVADPPRAGLGTDLAAELMRLQPERLTIVSCDPATLARDLRIFESLYRIKRISLIDLFPQTFHFETVAHLGRK